MGRLKNPLNLLILAVAGFIVWQEYQQRSGQRSGQRAQGAGSAPVDDRLAGPIGAVKRGAAQVATAVTEVVRPDAAEAPAVEAEGPPPLEGAVRGDGSPDCPEGFPIKGNATSRIYHQPGTASYERTVPEFCFATEEAAETAGFRAPKS